MNNIKSNVKNNVRIDCCIYCGETNGKLTTEHIYPKCLHTQESKIYWTLNKAVCVKCQKNTHEIDSYICEKLLRDYRYLTNKKSRSKYKNYSDVKKVRAKKDNSIIEIEVDVADLGWMYILPVYGMPELASKGIKNKIKGFQKLKHADLEKLRGVQEKYGIREIEYKVDFKNELFIRFLAKIAYSFAILEHGYEYLKDSPLLPIILGKSTNDATQYIGTLEKTTFKDTDTVGFKIYGGKDNFFRHIEMKILKGVVPIYIVIYKK